MQRYIIIGRGKTSGDVVLRTVSSADAFRAEIREMGNFIAYPWARREEAQQALREAPWATPQEKTLLLRKLKKITDLAK